MPRSAAATPEEYLAELPADRADTLRTVREVILANLPDGFEETMAFGMIGYVVPLDRYPDTYNKQPLQYAALAAQKNYSALYLNCVYADDARLAEFRERFAASGRRLDMGKSCVRFKAVDDLPLDVVADEIASTGVDDFIAVYERARG